MSLPLEGGGPQEGRQADGVGTADVAMLAGMRDAAPDARSSSARSRCSSPRSSSSSRSLQDDRERARRTGPSCSAASRRTTSSSRTPPSARRPRPRSSATTLKKTQPARGAASSRRSPTRARRRWSGRARRPSSTTRCSSTTTPVSRRTTFPQNPPPAYPRLDEVYYYLAYEYEQAGDTANARRVYLDLITKTPNSKYIPNAYLAFGELFFNEAQGDPTKWEPAKQAYQKVIAKPPPDNKVYGYAWYKLAYVFWNQGDFAARARRVQEDDRLRRRSSRSSRTRRSSPRARARTSSRSTRSRATRRTPTTSSRT